MWVLCYFANTQCSHLQLISIASSKPWITKNTVCISLLVFTSQLKHSVDLASYKPHICPLSPLAIAHQYLPFICLAMSVLAMPIMACLQKNILFAVGEFTETDGAHQFALSLTALTLVGRGQLRIANLNKLCGRIRSNSMSNISCGRQPSICMLHPACGRKS